MTLCRIRTLVVRRNVLSKGARTDMSGAKVAMRLCGTLIMLDRGLCNVRSTVASGRSSSLDDSIEVGFIGSEGPEALSTRGVTPEPNLSDEATETSEPKRSPRCESVIEEALY